MRPSTDISWVVETRGVTLISRQQGVYVSIPYPHAGLWAILADGTYSPERARELMGILMATGEREAEGEVALTLAAWQKAGLLVTE